MLVACSFSLWKLLTMPPVDLGMALPILATIHLLVMQHIYLSCLRGLAWHPKISWSLPLPVPHRLNFLIPFLRGDEVMWSQRRGWKESADSRGFFFWVGRGAC